MISTVEKMYSSEPVVQFTNTYKVTYDNGKIVFVPHNEANTDYQEYLEWVAEGNTPEPADET